MGNLRKRLNPHHRMAPNFDKRSDDDDAIIIEEKRDNSNLFRPLPKGQIIQKADWCAIDSPKKQTNEFVFLS